MRAKLIISFLLAGLPIAEAAAQWPAEIAPSTRVQVRLPEAEFQAGAPRGLRVRGRVTRLSADTLYLAVTDSVGSLAIPRSLIQQLHYSRGVPSRPLSALTHGVRVGIGLALTVALLNELDDDSDLSFGEAALLGGGVGLAVGGVIGALRPDERWHRVRLEVRVPAPN